MIFQGHGRLHRWPVGNFLYDGIGFWPRQQFSWGIYQAISSSAPPSSSGSSFPPSVLTRVQRFVTIPPLYGTAGVLFVPSILWDNHLPYWCPSSQHHHCNWQILLAVHQQERHPTRYNVWSAVYYHHAGFWWLCRFVSASRRECFCLFIIRLCDAAYKVQIFHGPSYQLVPLDRIFPSFLIFGVVAPCSGLLPEVSTVADAALASPVGLLAGLLIYRDLTSSLWFPVRLTNAPYYLHRWCL